MVDYIINENIAVEGVFLRITEQYAEEYLSVGARELAKKENGYYYWLFNSTATVVRFELPFTMKADFLDLMVPIRDHCMQYLKDNNITDNTIYSIYLGNLAEDLKRNSPAEYEKCKEQLLELQSIVLSAYEI